MNYFVPQIKAGDWKPFTLGLACKSAVLNGVPLEKIKGQRGEDLKIPMLMSVAENYQRGEIAKIVNDAAKANKPADFTAEHIIKIKECAALNWTGSPLIAGQIMMMLDGKL